jgi:hypothetical protein
MYYMQLPVQELRGRETVGSTSNSGTHMEFPSLIHGPNVVALLHVQFTIHPTMPQDEATASQTAIAVIPALQQCHAWGPAVGLGALPSSPGGGRGAGNDRE